MFWLVNPSFAYTAFVGKFGNRLLPAIALGLDPSDKDIMERKPENSKKKVCFLMVWE